MHDDRSLLHFVYYRCDDDNGLDLLRAILQRPDLNLDQKGNGINEHGETVLGVATNFLIFLVNADLTGNFYNLCISSTRG